MKRHYRPLRLDEDAIDEMVARLANPPARLRKPRVPRMSHDGAKLIADMGIVQALNRNPETPGGKRVERIIQLLQQAEELRLAIRKNLPSFLSKFPEEDLQMTKDGIEMVGSLAHIEPVNRQLKATLKKLNRALSRYSFVRQFWCRKYRSELKAGNAAAAPIRKADRGEWKAVLWLAGDGHVIPALRLRRCRMCNAWFYALRPRKQHCSDNCRKRFAFAAKGEESKKQAREYMRKYRRLQRELDEQAKQLARPKGGR